MLIFGENGSLEKLPKELLIAVRNSYLNNIDTISTQTLDLNGISYSVRSHKEDAFTCEAVAKARNIRLSQVLKCLVACDIENNLYVILIPGDKILKLKKMRKIAKASKINLAPLEMLVMNFGLTVGAINPIQFLNNFDKWNVKFFLDKTVINEHFVDISSGSLDSGILLKTKDLVELINPIICDVISNKNDV